MTTSTPPRGTGLELVITRVFNAPRETVWQAWTELERARAWWGPEGFTVPELELAEHPGDPWRAVMRSPEGETFPQHGVLTDASPPERLAFTLIWANDTSRQEMLVTVTLLEAAGKTAMTFRKGPFHSAVSRWGEEEAWTEAFNRLTALLACG